MKKVRDWSGIIIFKKTTNGGNWSGIIFFSSKENFHDPDSPVFSTEKTRFRLSIPAHKPSSWLAHLHKNKNTLSGAFLFLWRWRELNPRAESSYKEVYMLSALFCLSSEILKRTKYPRTDSLCFGKESRPSPPYPDNIMPQLMYRKSMRETPVWLTRKLEQMQTHFRKEIRLLLL